MYCPECGTKLENKKCPSCGFLLSPENMPEPMAYRSYPGQKEAVIESESQPASMPFPGEEPAAPQSAPPVISGAAPQKHPETQGSFVSPTPQGSGYQPPYAPPPADAGQSPSPAAGYQPPYAPPPAAGYQSPYTPPPAGAGQSPSPAAGYQPPYAPPPAAGYQPPYAPPPADAGQAPSPAAGYQSPFAQSPAGAGQPPAPVYGGMPPKKGLKGWQIALIVVGAVAAVVLIIVLLFSLAQKKIEDSWADAQLGSSIWEELESEITDAIESFDGNEDFSIVLPEEGSEEMLPEEGSEEMLPEEGSEESAASAEVTAAFEEQVLYDDQGVKVTLLAVDTSGFIGPVLKVKIENNLSDSVMMQVQRTSVNGCMVDMYCSVEITSGKVANDEILLNGEDLARYGITEIRTVELALSFIDPESYETILETEPITILDSSGEIYVQEIEVSGVELANEQGIQFVCIRAKEGLNGIELEFYFENHSDQTIFLTADSVSINGMMAEVYFYDEVAPGKVCVASMGLFNQEDLPIDSVEDVEVAELSLTAYGENYETILTTGLIEIEFT